MIYVQFADVSSTAIASVFGTPQDPVAHPNQGTVETNDPRWKTFYESIPVGMQPLLPTPTI